MTAIYSAIVGAFTTVGGGILEFIKSGFTTLFYDVVGEGSSATQTVSAFAVFVFSMLGISLTIGLTRWIVSLVRRKI